MSKKVKAQEVKVEVNVSVRFVVNDKRLKADLLNALYAAVEWNTQGARKRKRR